MTTDQAQDKPADFDFQTAFLQAATQRSVQYTIGTEGNKKLVLIRRWSLSQQMQLGHSMSIILNTVASNLAKYIKVDDGGQVSISFQEILDNTLVFSAVMEQCSEHLFRVIAATLAPNFKTLEAAQEYTESLDIADAMQLVMLIVKHNAMTEEAKKKFVDLANALPKIPNLPSQSHSAG